MPVSIPSFWSSSGTQGKRGQDFLLSLPRLTHRRELARALAGKTVKKQAERGEFPARTGSSSRALFLRLEIKGERGENLVLCSLKAVAPMKNRRNSCPAIARALRRASAARGQDKKSFFLALDCALCENSGQDFFLSVTQTRLSRERISSFIHEGVTNPLFFCPFGAQTALKMAIFFFARPAATSREQFLVRCFLRTEKIAQLRENARHGRRRG